MNISVSVLGAAQLARKFAQLSDDVSGKALENAVVSGALLVQNDAKRRAPYRTGNLRRSIHVGGHTGKSELAESTGTDIGGNKSDQKYAEVLVGTNVDYARVAEYGRGKRQPHPYLRPAVDENKDAVAREIGEALKILLSKL